MVINSRLESLSARAAVTLVMAAACALLAFVVISEIFSNRNRGMAMSVCIFFLWIAVYVVSQSFPMLLDSIGSAFTFWIYMLMSVFAFLFVYKLIPETKGKSLEDMMAYVDEDGNITSTPPDPQKKRVINAEDIEIGVPKSHFAEDPVKEGRIDYFDSAKGFGFIIQNNGMKVFFHINQTNYPVSEGDVVQFTVVRGPKGLSAVGVEKKP